MRRAPAKFSFVLDALGRLPLGDIDADIRFEAIAGRGVRGLSRRRRRAGRAMRARRDRRRRGEARERVRQPCRRRRRRGTEDERSRRARRGRARVRGGGLRDEAARAFQAPRVVARRPRRPRFRRGDRRRRGGGLRRNRGEPIQGVDRACAGSWSERAQAHALAGLRDHRPRPARRRFDGRFDREARIRLERRRAAPAHCGLPRRARLHARGEGGARGRGALGAAPAEGRRRRSPCQRLRQGVRETGSRQRRL